MRKDKESNQTPLDYLKTCDVQQTLTRAVIAAQASESTHPTALIHLFLSNSANGASFVNDTFQTCSLVKPDAPEFTELILSEYAAFTPDKTGDGRPNPVFVQRLLAMLMHDMPASVSGRVFRVPGLVTSAAEFVDRVRGAVITVDLWHQAREIFALSSQDVPGHGLVENEDPPQLARACAEELAGRLLGKDTFEHPSWPAFVGAEDFSCAVLMNMST